MGVIRSMVGGLKRGFSPTKANKRIKLVETEEGEVESNVEEEEEEEESEEETKAAYDDWMDHDFVEDKLDCQLTCAATQAKLLQRQKKLLLPRLAKLDNPNSMTTAEADDLTRLLAEMTYMVGIYASQEKPDSKALDNLNGFAYDNFIL